MDVNPQTIGALERGDHYPSLELAFRICEVFELPVEAVFSRRPFAPLSTQLYRATRKGKSRRWRPWGAWLCGWTWRERTAGSSAAVLDECERAIRDRLGYRAFTVSILVNAAVAGFLFAGVRMPHLGAHVGLLLSPTLGAAAVPTGTLAATTPDDDPEDLADA